MIKQIRGTILQVTDQYLVIEAMGGLGFQVFVSNPEEYKVDDSIQLFTHTIIRETGISLYGFASLEEETVFKTIISLPKIGPKIALGILSVFTLSELFHCIAEGTPEELCKAPGVGQTTARKIHIELSEKWKNSFPAQSQETIPDIYSEAFELLQEMDLSPAESRLLLRKLQQKGFLAHSAEELVREVLKNRK